MGDIKSAPAPDGAVTWSTDLSFSGIDLIRQGRDLFSVAYDLCGGWSLSAVTKVAAVMLPEPRPFGPELNRFDCSGNAWLVRAHEALAFL